MVRIVSQRAVFLIAFSTFEEIILLTGQGWNLYDVLLVTESGYQRYRHP